MALTRCIRLIAQHTAAATVVLAVLHGSASATSYTWSGNGGDNNWSTLSNWLNNIKPSNATTDAIFFGATPRPGSSGSPLILDVNNRAFGSLNFQAGAASYYIDGSNAFSISGDVSITQASTNAQTIANAFAHSGTNSGYTVTLGGDGTGVVTLSGNFTAGSGQRQNALQKSGDSIFVLSGNNSFSNGVTINAGTLVAGSANGLGSGSITVSSGATLAIGNTVTFTQSPTWSSGSILGGLGIFRPGSTFSVASGRHVAPGIADGTNDVNTLSIGYSGNTTNTTFASGSYLDIDLNGTSADRLNVTGSVTVNNGANLVLNTLSTPTLGNYILLSATTGSFTNSFTSTGVPTYYRVTMNNSRELDLQHWADQTMGGAAPTTINIIRGGTATITATLTNTAPSGSTGLVVGLADNGSTGGTFGSFTGAGPVTAGSGITVGATLTAGSTVGMGRTWNLRNYDPGAVNNTVSVSGTVNVYDHASPVYTPVTLALGNIHVGYTSTANSSNSFTVTDGGISTEYRVDLKGSGSGTGNVALTTIAGLHNDGTSSATLRAILGTGIATGTLLDQNITYTFADDSTLAGNATVGTPSIAVTGQVYSGQMIWTGATGGNWGAAANWNDSTNASVHAAPGLDAAFTNTDRATFGNTVGTVTVNLSGSNPSLAGLTLTGTGSYAIAQGSGGTLTFATTSGAATLSVTGSHAVSAPIALGSGLNVTATGAGDSLSISGVVSGNQALTKGGSGTLALSGSNSYSGGTTISNGTLVVNHANALGPSGTISNSGTLAIGSGITFTRSVTFNSGSTLAGLGTFTPGSTVTAGSGGLTHVAPGILDGTNTVATLAIGNSTTFGSGSYLDIDLSGASADRLNVTGSVTVNSGANLALNTLSAPTAGNYVLLSASTGSFTNSFTSTGVPSGYRVTMTGTRELDLKHLAVIAQDTLSVGTASLITGGTTSISGKVANTAPSGSYALNYNVTGSSGLSGLPTGQSRNAGDANGAAGAAFSGIFTAGSTFGDNTLTVTAADTDGNSTGSATSNTVHVMVYNHANGVLTLTSSASVNAIAGQVITPTLTFLNSGANNDSLTIQGSTNLGGLNSGTYAAGTGPALTVGTILAAAGTNTSKGYAVTWLEDQTILGATAGSQTTPTQTVTVRGYSHAAGVLTLTSENIVKAIVGASVTPTFTFANNGANNAGLTIQSAANLSGYSGGMIGGGGAAAVTAVAITAPLTAGTSASQNYSVTWLEDQSVIGATAGNQTTPMQTVTLNAYDHALPSLMSPGANIGRVMWHENSTFDVSTTLSNASGVRADLEITGKGGMIDSGQGNIAPGTGRLFTARLNLNVAGTVNSVHTMTFSDDTDLPGAAPLTDLTYTVTGYVVKDRVVHGNAVGFGNVLLHGYRSATATLSTIGDSSAYTKIKVAGQLFDHDGETGEATIAQTFAAYGPAGGSQSLPMVGEGLTDENPVPVNVLYSANVGWASPKAGHAFSDPLVSTVDAAHRNLTGLASKTLYDATAGIVGTEATLLGGTDTVDGTLSMAWRTRTDAEVAVGGGHVPGLLSDVVDLSGMVKSGPHQTDVFVLQMTYDDSAFTVGEETQWVADGRIHLGYLDPATNRWVNAIEGNIGANTTDPALWNVQGDWTGVLQLGAWGVNTSKNTVWAVLDHNSEFGVVPEPGTLVLLLAGMAALLVWRRRTTR